MKGYAHRPSPLSESRSSRQACVTLHPAPCRAMLLYMNDTVLSRTGDAFLCACAPAGALLRRNAESRNAAAGGRGRHCGKPAAVGESEEQRKPERFSGYRKAGRGRFLITEAFRGRRSFPGCMSAPDFGFLQLRGRGACRLAFRFSFFLFRISFSLPYGCREAGIKSQVILDRRGHSP